MRTADPYRDLAVIDARAPRFNQAVVGIFSLVAASSGAWAIFAILAAQLAVGLLFGRKYCLPCVVYFELVQPRWGEGPLEDSRPPRFANILGCLFLTAAFLAHLLGAHRLGNALGLMVAALALLATTTGLCAGCELYRFTAHLKGIRSKGLVGIDLTELGAEKGVESIVQFSHPLCTECREMEKRLSGASRPLLLVDVSKRPDLAKKYGVSLVPLAYLVGTDGRVLSRMG